MPFPSFLPLFALKEMPLERKAGQRKANTQGTLKYRRVAFDLYAVFCNQILERLYL